MPTCRGFDRIIARTLEKDPRLRYQTAGDLVSELHRLRRDTDARRMVSSGSAPSVDDRLAARRSRRRRQRQASPRPGPTARRVPRAIVFGVPAVLVLGVAGFWLWNSTRTPAFTERDVILVADFANSTGDPVFDDALKQAVSVQLQQTAFVTLLPDRQIQSTLALMQCRPRRP